MILGHLQIVSLTLLISSISLLGGILCLGSEGFSPCFLDLAVLESDTTVETLSLRDKSFTVISFLFCSSAVFLDSTAFLSMLDFQLKNAATSSSGYSSMMMIVLSWSPFNNQLDNCNCSSSKADIDQTHYCEVQQSERLLLINIIICLTNSRNLPPLIKCEPVSQGVIISTLPTH